MYLYISPCKVGFTGRLRDDVAPPKPAAPLAAAPAAPAPTPATPAAEYSCGDGYIFDTDQVRGPEGAVVNDVFYWGSSTSGAARCFSDTRNNSIVGRVESNADDATSAIVMSVTLPDGRRWYFILQFPDGTYCAAATAADGRATCFATVERDATGFRVDDLPAVPLPVPAGAPGPPPEDPNGPGGGDEGGGHTGAPEPEEPVGPGGSYDYEWTVDVAASSALNLPAAITADQKAPALSHMNSEGECIKTYENGKFVPRSAGSSDLHPDDFDSSWTRVDSNYDARLVGIAGGPAGMYLDRNNWRISGTPSRIGDGTLTVRYAVTLNTVVFFKGRHRYDFRYRCWDISAYRAEDFPKYSFTKTWAVKPADSGE